MHTQTVISAACAVLLGLIAIYQTQVLRKLRVSGTASAALLMEGCEAFEAFNREWLAEREGLLRKLEGTVTALVEYRRAVRRDDFQAADGIQWPESGAPGRALLGTLSGVMKVGSHIQAADWIQAADKIIHTLFDWMKTLDTSEMDEVSFIRTERIRMRIKRALNVLQKQLGSSSYGSLPEDLC